MVYRTRRWRYARRRTTRRSSRRSYGRKRPVYRSPVYRRRTRRTSTRRILNVSSQKKKDTMIGFTDVTAGNPETGEFQQSPAVMAASTASFFTFAWLASGRPAEDVNGAKGSKINEGIRTSTSIFCRGLKERITFNTSSGVPWEWRRIVFTIKKADFQDSSDPNTSKFFRITSNGMARLVTLIPNEDIFIELFDGARFQDWLAPLSLHDRI